ncbi:PREDICTED: uncharacterized protein LOC101372180, partial [Odobenus rosmarus divergens]|uniref:Uncharacterized protein LOC101372180 n=1 Tax=Odobenus rosmarus divergens TaxID=9708 RepID=A0A9B0M6F8_ODORO
RKTETRPNHLCACGHGKLLGMTVGGRRQTREWWRDPRCHPAKPLRPARRPSPEPQTQRRGGEPGPRSGEPPDSRRRALTPSRRRLPGPAGCATPPAASPGKRGRRARFLLGFLRLGPSSSPRCGGQWAPRLRGWAGGAGAAAAPPRGRPAPAPADLDPAGARREVLASPLPFSKKSGKKDHSAINEVVTKEYSINTHKCIHGVGFKRCAPWALKEICKFAMEDMGTPDMCIDTRIHKAV